MCYCMSIHSFPFLFFCPQHTVYCVVIKGSCFSIRSVGSSLRERENEFDNDNYMGIAKEIMIGYIFYTKSIQAKHILDQISTGTAFFLRDDPERLKI